MDNLCHTLAGAALAEAGLRRRTALAYATCLIGANLPDVDALAYLRDPLFALSFRRGWTHGALAMVALPVALGLGVVAWDRLVRRNPAAPADLRGLVLVAGAALLSHPLLDLLNTYGVRLLMPFSGRWFHADALFIIDPFLWAVFAIGVAVAAWRRAHRADAHDAERPARIAIAVAVAYIGLMAGSSVAARSIVRREAGEAGIQPVGEVLVSPLLLDPLHRSVVLTTSGGYRRGTFGWIGKPHLSLEPGLIPRGLDDPLAAEAAHSPAGTVFLGWARFPAAVIRPTDPPVVRLYDLRYAGPAGGWAAVDIKEGQTPVTNRR